MLNYKFLEKKHKLMPFIEHRSFFLQYFIPYLPLNASFKGYNSCRSRILFKNTNCKF